MLMLRSYIRAMGLAVLLAAGFASAANSQQASTALVVTACGTLPPGVTYAQGQLRTPTQDTTGKNCGSGGGGGTPGGSNTQVQYNNSGAFGGITGATTNGTTLTLVAPILGTPASGNGSNLTALNATQLTSGTVAAARGGAGTINGLLKANGSGVVSQAVSSTDYAPATSGSSILSGSGSGGFSNVTVGSGLSFAAGTLSATGGGSGTVTSITAGNAINLSTNPCVATCTISGTVTTNTQTGTTYAIASTDGGKVVTAANGSAQAYSIVQANTAGFTAGYGPTVSNIGAGTVTITAATSTFGNGLTTLAVAPGQGAQFGSDSTNYPITLMSLPVMAQDTVLGTFGSANYPVAQTVPSCANDGAHALVFAAHALACASISGGSGTVTTLTAGTNITFSSGATCTTTCTVNASGGGSTYTATFSGNASGTPGVAGLTIAEATATLTDNNTAGSGTAALFTGHSIAAPTFAATNATVTTTEADTLYIAGPPTAGANDTLTKAMSAVIATGDMGFKSNASVLRMYNVGGPGVTNREEADFNWSGNTFNISTAKNGTGAARDILLGAAAAVTLQPAAGNSINFNVAGTGTIAFMNSLNFVSNTTNGATIALSVAGSATVPTLISNRGGTNSGIGGAANVPAVIVGAATIENWSSTGPAISVIPTDATHTDASLCRDTTSGAELTGTGTIGICLGTSSARFKHGITDLAPGLTEIMKLQPKGYHLNADHRTIRAAVLKDGKIITPAVVGPDKEYYGFLAEDMTKVLPKLVGNDNKGRPNTADYLGLVPVLVKAVQQQQIQIAAMNKTVMAQQAQIIALKRETVVLQQASVRVPHSGTAAVKKAGFF